MTKCKKCEYKARLNGDGLCSSCCQEAMRSKEVCPTCDRWVEKGGAECTRCGFWRHKECEGLSEAGLKLVNNMDVWFCKVCSTDWKMDQEKNEKMRDELNGLKQKNTEINNKMRALENRCDSWSKNVERPTRELTPGSNTKERENEARDTQPDLADIKEDIRKLRQDNDDFRGMIVELEGKWEKREEEIVNKVMDKVVQYMDEVQERERKRKNVVMFNVPESKGKDIGEEVADDMKKCREVFDALEVREAKIERIYRIGSRKSEKARPIIVELNEVGTKWKLVKCSKNLKHARHTGVRQVIIAPDLTRKEREENDRLRDELRFRRQAGGKWIIRRGQVISLANESEVERSN